MVKIDVKHVDVIGVNGQYAVRRDVDRLSLVFSLLALIRELLLDTET